MGRLKYARPQDINVHIFGETRMSTKRRSYIRRALQFVGFLIFRMAAEREERVGPFSVTATHKYDREIVELFRYDEPVIAMITNGSGEWIVRIDGMIEEVFEFVMEYITHSFADKAKSNNIKEVE